MKKEEGGSGKREGFYGKNRWGDISCPVHSTQRNINSSLY